MKALELKKDIYWVGALDPNLKIFDIIMYTPYGTTYNSYVVKGNEKIAIFETVKDKFFDQYIKRLKSLNIDIEKIDYIVVDHTEPDHAGSAAKLLDIAKNAKVVGSACAIQFLKNIANRDFDSITVKTGDSISLGNKTLKFINAPFLHWPDSIYTYVEEDNVLLTCDSFGAHYCFDGVFNDLITNEADYMDALRYYYNMIFGPFKPYVLSAIDKIKDLKIDMLCPGHGPVLRENLWDIVNTYKKWSTETIPIDNNTITLCYVSAYGYTEAVANKIIEGINSVGDFKINSYNVIHHDMNEILEKLSQSSAVLFGSPTINGDALKPIWDILVSLNPIVHGGKVSGAFGSYGWSGEGVPNIEERLRQLRMDLVPSFAFNFKPTEEDLTTAFQYGESVAEKIKENINKDVKPNKPSTQKRWKCIVCGEVFEGNTPPEVCPACGAGVDQFIEVTEEVITFQSDKKEKFIVVGNGVAGFYATDAIRKRNKACDIEILSSEKYLTYYRPSLSEALHKQISDDTFYLANENWYKENNIKLTLGVKVNSINSDKKLLSLDNNEEIKYDKLILANGSYNFVPPIEGIKTPGVFTLKNMNDLNNIKKKMSESKKVVVIGGGLLGLEAAWYMKNAGLDVTIVEWAKYLLNKQLDKEGSKIVTNAIESCGINIITGDSAEKITGENKVSSVILQSGKELETDLVLFSIGIRPNTYIVEGTNVKTNLGILVNKKMETNIKDIYACGDVSEINEKIYGTWSAAIEMGKTAGANAVGDTKTFEDFIDAFSFNAMNLGIFSCGSIPKNTTETLQLSKPNENLYKKIYFKDNKAVAGVLMGDTSKSVKLMTTLEKENSIDEVLKMDIL